MRRLPHLIAVACWAAASPVAASPATDFFDLVRSRIEERYYAKPGVDVAAILDAAEQGLASACQAAVDTCSVEFGIEAARQAVAALGDSHTRLEQVTPSLGAAAGPAARSTPLGWMVRSVRGGDALYVAWVAPEGPAARAGVRRHDLIVGSSGAGAAALTSLAEPARLTLSREGRSFVAELTPQTAAASPMPRLDFFGDIALLQLPTGSGDGVAQAAHDLIARAQGEGAKALILDLRDNGGGGVQCAAIASAFVDYAIVQTDRDGSRRVLTVTPGEVRVVSEDGVEMLTVERPARWTGPMAILVNDNTASCSEAVAVQAARAGRALIIGEPTVGVGNNVVAPVPLTDGWRMVMAVAYSTTLEGESLPSRPPLDIEVEDDPLEIAATGRDRVLETAIERLGR
jgi:carboxyl-terminal processing protease